MAKKLPLLLTLLLLTFSSITADYIIKAGRRTPTKIDRLPFKSVLDMKKIPQNTSYYAKQISAMPWSKQKRYDNRYNRRFFAPWYMKEMNEPAEDMTWQIRFVQKRKIYDGHKSIITEKSWKWWIKNSNMEKMDTVHQRAISITHSNLRAFPTYTEAYRNPWKSTEGFPFDYNQNSELHINTPLYISHYSLDRKWAFVHASHAFGWVKFSDIALVNHKFIEQFKTGAYAISIHDDLFLYKNNKKISIIKLGTVFPMSKNNKFLLVAEKNNKSYALARKLKRPSVKLIAKKPLRFTSKNVAKIAKEFYNEPYGWGGKLQTRDCSATTRDFFGCFGIFLDRNSAKQSRGGKAIKIKGMKKKLKKAAIIKYAKPFQSMLYVPGHIGIYLGHYKNEPVIMHTYWGVRLKNWSKYTLSRTIITTTEPGKELPDIREKSKLINTLQTIINF